MKQYLRRSCFRNNVTKDIQILMAIINEYILYISTIHILLQVYNELLNKVLSSGYIPQDWLIGGVIPIQKGVWRKSQTIIVICY